MTSANPFHPSFLNDFQFNDSIIQIDTLHNDVIDESCLFGDTTKWNEQQTPRSNKYCHHSKTLDISENSLVSSARKIVKKENLTPHAKIGNFQTPNTKSVNFQTPKSSLNVSVSSSSSSKSVQSTRSSLFSEKVASHPTIKEANRLLNEKKFHAAIDSLNIPLKEGKFGISILAECAFLTGMAYRSLENFKKSIEYLLLARKYKHPRATNALGVIYQQVGKNDQALTWYRESQQLFPSDSSSFYNAGLILFQRAKALKEMLNVDYSSSSNSTDLDHPQFAEESKQLISTSLLTVSKSSAPNINVISSNSDQDQKEEMRQRENPNMEPRSSSQIKCEKSRVTKLNKLVEASRKMFEKASRRGHKISHFQLGKLALFEEKVDLAIIHFSKGSLKQDPYSMIALAELYLKGQKIEKDIDKSKKLLLESCSFQENPKARLILAHLALAENKFELAHEYFLLSKSLVESQFQLGLLYMYGKGCSLDTDKAYQYLSSACTQYPISIYYMARIQQQNGDLEKALNLYRQCVQILEGSQLADCCARIRSLTKVPLWKQPKVLFFVGSVLAVTLGYFKWKRTHDSS